MSRGLFCRKTILCEQEVFFLYHCWILKEIFIIFILNFSEELSILHSRCLEEHFHKDFSSKNYQNYLLYFEFWANFCRQVCHNCCRQTNNFSYTFSGWSWTSFSILNYEQKNGFLPSFFPGSFVKSAVYVSAWTV